MNIHEEDGGNPLCISVDGMKGCNTTQPCPDLKTTRFLLTVCGNEEHNKKKGDVVCDYLKKQVLTRMSSESEVDMWHIISREYIWFTRDPDGTMHVWSMEPKLNESDGCFECDGSVSVMQISNHGLVNIRFPSLNIERRPYA